jgi:hypothetical protein
MMLQQEWRLSMYPQVLKGQQDHKDRQVTLALLVQLVEQGQQVLKALKDRKVILVIQDRQACKVQLVLQVLQALVV